jgi:hypothetical protein
MRIRERDAEPAIAFPMKNRRILNSKILIFRLKLKTSINWPKTASE